MQQVSEEKLKEIQETFSLFDKNGDGTISVAELGFVMHDLGHKMTEKEVQAIIDEADIDGNGQIDLKEFT